MGYCPQFDTTLVMSLSARANLALWCRVHGLAPATIPRHIDAVARAVALPPELLNRTVSNLSGGSKRKLAVAVALLARPALTVLDEPTTGLDPASRQRLWRGVRAWCATEGRALLFTTQYLPEAGAHADRVAILSSGRLR